MLKIIVLLQHNIYPNFDRKNSKLWVYDETSCFTAAQHIPELCELWYTQSLLFFPRAKLSIFIVQNSILLGAQAPWKSRGNQWNSKESQWTAMTIINESIIVWTEYVFCPENNARHVASKHRKWLVCETWQNNLSAQKTIQSMWLSGHKMILSRWPTVLHCFLDITSSVQKTAMFSLLICFLDV